MSTETQKTLTKKSLIKDLSEVVGYNDSPQNQSHTLISHW